MKIKKFKIVLISIILLFIFQVKVNASTDIVVALDPGHGGNDTGATYGGVLEKNVTWKIASKVKQILDSTPGITGILVRQENENPSLYERGVCATKNGADLLVSFHINSNSKHNSASGAEVYITGNINSPRYYNASKTLGQTILNNFGRIGLRPFCAVPKIKTSRDGELYADGFISDYYGIIRNPMYYGIPGVLVEHCFINNDYDRNTFLTTDAQIDAMAEQDAYAIIQNKELFRTDKSKNCVNSELKKLEVNESKTHITGEIIVVDWLYGMQSVPVDKPVIKLVPTDGSEPILCYVSKITGNTYYFDTWLSGINPYKKYMVEVSTQNVKSIPTNNKMPVYLGTDRIVYQDSNDAYCISNNMIKKDKSNLKYSGDVVSEITELNSIKDSNYVTGKTVVVEWVDGKSTVPKTLPIIKIKSTDNKYIKKCFVKHIKGNTYYFDACINNIDINNQYIVEVSTENEYNTSKNVRSIARINSDDTIIGRWGDYTLEIKNGKIVFDEYKYVGNMNSEIKKLKLDELNGNSYLNGEIIIVEWIDGKSTVPNKKPKMKLRSIDNEVELDVFVVETNTNTYYFDRFIEGIDTTRQYELIVESGNENNISQYRSVKVYFNKQFVSNELGKYRQNIVKVQNSKITFEPIISSIYLKGKNVEKEIDILNNICENEIKMEDKVKTKENVEDERQEQENNGTNDENNDEEKIKDEKDAEDEKKQIEQNLKNDINEIELKEELDKKENSDSFIDEKQNEKNSTL